MGTDKSSIHRGSWQAGNPGRLLCCVLGLNSFLFEKPVFALQAFQPLDGARLHMEGRSLCPKSADLSVKVTLESLHSNFWIRMRADTWLPPPSQIDTGSSLSSTFWVSHKPWRESVSSILLTTRGHFPRFTPSSPIRIGRGEHLP